jgi:hypothetical protein
MSLIRSLNLADWADNDGCYGLTVNMKIQNLDLAATAESHEHTGCLQLQECTGICALAQKCANSLRKQAAYPLTATPSRAAVRAPCPASSSTRRRRRRRRRQAA